MRAITILFAVLLSSVIRLNGQSRTIYGRVIDDIDLLPIPRVHIQTINKSLLGETGKDGRFKIDLPQTTQTLLLGFPGFEKATIELNNNCDTVDVVMMTAGTYDFMSSKKIDKLRLERFNKLPELHLQAYKKGLFTTPSACYIREFEAERRQLDSIAREDVKIRNQIKLTFKKLNVGDTVRIPFSDVGGYRADGTDRTTIIRYSSFSGGHHYSGCIAKCIIIDKNKHKRAYNIVCKVVSCDGCKDPSVFDGRVMKAGEVFTYNMKYFEILETKQ